MDDGKGGRIAFADADPERLATDPAPWTFRPGEAWHGFGDIPDGWCMLDPIKVGIVCPGMGDDGEMLEQGIPAAMLSSYLYRHGIIPSRTTDFMVLCLFSMGVTKGKWGTLISTLLDFKKDYDANRALAECLPHLVATAPGKYARMGLRDLSDLMFQQMRSSGLDRWQAAAFGSLPHPVMPPRQASGLLNEGCAELLPIDRLADRVAGVGIIPYPPGIPIIMPGESFGPDDGPWLSYMRSLQDWGCLPGVREGARGRCRRGRCLPRLVPEGHVARRDEHRHWPAVLGLAIIAWPAGAVAMTASQVAQPAGWRDRDRQARGMMRDAVIEALRAVRAKLGG